MIISHWPFTRTSLSFSNDELTNNMIIRQQSKHTTEFYWSSLRTEITSRKEPELILAKNCSQWYCEDNIIDVLSNLGEKLRNWRIVSFLVIIVRDWGVFLREFYFNGTLSLLFDERICFNLPCSFYLILRKTLLFNRTSKFQCSIRRRK
jgi:hypothetical protein